ncbi:MAG: hypothetical protein EUB_03801 [Eubacterium sp.]
MGVLFVYKAKSTGLASPVFASRRIVVVSLLYMKSAEAMR